MATNPEQLFDSLLGKPAAVHALIGRTEDLHLDCKVWPSKDDDLQRIIAKSVSGFANADGGVIVFGLNARRGPDKDDPDEIQSAELVGDTRRAKTRMQDLIGELVEPGVNGVRVEEINEPGSKAGFVIVLVPATDGSPCRSRKDWKFYQRISSGTHAMEYFQVADMFGKRHRPVLDLHLLEGAVAGTSSSRYRPFEIGITNKGRALAKYPGLRYRNLNGLPRTMTLPDSTFGLPYRSSETDWLIFGGGVDNVIYPGETFRIARLFQPGFEETVPLRRLVFPKWSIHVYLSAEDTETTEFERTFGELSIH